MAKELNKRVNIWLNQKGIDDNLSSVRKEISKTANELAKLPLYSEEWYAKAKKFAELKSIQDDYKRRLDDIVSSTKNLTEETSQMSGQASKGFLGLISSAKTAFGKVTQFVEDTISAIEPYIDAYAKIDDAMTNVSKYTGLSREEVKQLHESVKNIDNRTSTNELLKIAEVGGRMGRLLAA